MVFFISVGVSKPRLSVVPPGGPTSVSLCPPPRANTVFSSYRDFPSIPTSSPFSQTLPLILLSASLPFSHKHSLLPFSLPPYPSHTHSLLLTLLSTSLPFSHTHSLLPSIPTSLPFSLTLPLTYPPLYLLILLSHTPSYPPSSLPPSPALLHVENPSPMHYSLCPFPILYNLTHTHLTIIIAFHVKPWVPWFYWSSTLLGIEIVPSQACMGVSL